MKVPYTINKRILKLYRSPANVFKSSNQIIAEDFEEWDQNLPKTLKEQCIQTIACNWLIQPLFKEIPELTDRLLLLELLPTDLPLDLTVPIIHEDVYWKRCYQKRWPRALPKNISEDVSYPIFPSTRSSRADSAIDSINEVSDILRTEDVFISKKTWKHFYLEMLLREFLEFLSPEEYEPEKIKLVSDICASYILVLNLTQMRCSKNGSDHIPLAAVLGGLNNLTELSITFQQTYVKESFSWNIFETSFNDIKLMCKAFEKLEHLQILRITRSDVDCEKFKLILKSLSLANATLIEIDFSSCKISNGGVFTLCEILADENNTLEKVTLANNKIGSEGAKSFSQIITKPTCNLKHLNLRLNHIGSEGGKCLIKELASPFSSLHELILAGCGIKNSGINIIPMLSQNTTLSHFDLSNNRFGEEFGKEILKGLERNTTLIKLDLRMCDLSSETNHAVKVLIHRNKKIAFRGKSKNHQ